MSLDCIILGLGNPGAQYEFTRHNLGFLALVALKQAWGLPEFTFNKYHNACESRGVRNQHRIGLFQPQTYMNLSGESLAKIRLSYPEARILVIYDDWDLPFAHLRIRKQGSAGSHNGMKSLIQHIKTTDFARIRLGIRPEHPVQDLKNFVLQKMKAPEMSELENLYPKIAESVDLILANQIDQASQKFNQTLPPSGV